MKLIGYSGRDARTRLDVVSDVGGSLQLRPYGNQQLTGPRRFRFVKSAVLKIGSGVGGRRRGQLHLHLRAAGVQLHRQRVASQRQMIPSATRVN